LYRPTRPPDNVEDRVGTVVFPINNLAFVVPDNRRQNRQAGAIGKQTAHPACGRSPRVERAYCWAMACQRRWVLCRLFPSHHAGKLPEKPRESLILIKLLHGQIIGAAIAKC
jgi:hypothetical protein